MPPKCELHFYFTFGVFLEANLCPDQLKYFLRGGAWVELYCVELSVHEVESGVNRAPVDGAQDLLLRRGPLPAPGAQSLVETLEDK
jgi:hypothetical protein